MKFHLELFSVCWTTMIRKRIFKHFDCMFMFMCAVFGAIKGELACKNVQTNAAVYWLYKCEFFVLCVSTRSHDYKRFNGVKVVIVCVWVYVSMSVVAHILMYAMSPDERKKRAKWRKNSFQKWFFLESDECHNYIDKTNWKKMFAILFEKWCFYKPIVELTHWRSALITIVSVVLSILFVLGIARIGLAWCVTMAWLKTCTSV